MIKSCINGYTHPCQSEYNIMAKPKQKEQSKPAREEEYFTVDKLMGKRSVKGETEYLVKWLGYSQDHATWENAINLTSIMDMILEFQCINQQEENSQFDDEITSARRHQTQFGSNHYEEPPQPLYHSLSHPHANKDEATLERLEFKPDSEEDDLEGDGRENEAVTNIAISKRLSNQGTSNLLAEQREKANQYGSSAMDISFQVRQIQTRFDKITDKYKGRKSKRQQKEMKMERKKTAHKEATPCKSRGRKKKGDTPAATQMIATQMLEKIDERCENSGAEKEQCGMRTRLRTHSSSPLARPQLSKEKEQKQKQGEAKSKRIKEKSEKKPIDESNDSIGLEFEGPRYQALHHQAVEEICNAVELAEEKKQHLPVKIQRLENLPNEPTEYILEYGSGVLRRFKILELMKTYPLEFASYLQAKSFH